VAVDFSQPLRNGFSCNYWIVRDKITWFEWLAVALFIAIVVGAIAMGTHPSAGSRGPVPGCVAGATC
jgi:hypothetical protein